MRKLIIAVDDDPKMLSLLKHMMRGTEYLILCQPTPESALRLMQSINVDLFILDIMMPNIDGFELASRIRQKDSLQNTPIMMLSAKDNATIRKKAAIVGANKFVSKRMLASTLLSEIKDVLSPKSISCYS